jgi:hypothetical protein
MHVIPISRMIIPIFNPFSSRCSVSLVTVVAELVGLSVGIKSYINPQAGFLAAHRLLFIVVSVIQNVNVQPRQTPEFFINTTRAPQR